MDRLFIISQINPSWGASIKEFVKLNPEFQPCLPYVALNRVADIPKELKTIKDMLIYYASFAGVNTNYGQKAWEWAKTNQLEKLTAKKRLIIEDVLKLPNITTFAEFEKINIKGVGEGAHTFIRQHYFHHTDIIYPTDRVFQKGLCRIYQLDKVTVSQAKNLCNQWKGEKSVGSMFCFQIANYASTSFKPNPPIVQKISQSPVKKIALKLKTVI